MVGFLQEMLIYLGYGSINSHFLYDKKRSGVKCNLLRPRLTSGQIICLTRKLEIFEL